MWPPRIISGTALSLVVVFFWGGVCLHEKMQLVNFRKRAVPRTL